MDNSKDYSRDFLAVGGRAHVCIYVINTNRKLVTDFFAKEFPQIQVIDLESADFVPTRFMAQNNVKITIACTILDKYAPKLNAYRKNTNDR